MGRESEPADSMRGEYGGEAEGRGVLRGGLGVQRVLLAEGASLTGMRQWRRPLWGWRLHCGLLSSKLAGERCASSS